MAYTGSHSYPYPLANAGGPPASPQAQQYPRPQAAARPPRPTAAPRTNMPSPVKRLAPKGPQNGSVKFELLQYMTTEQLQKLLENEDQLKEMVEDQEEVKQKKLDKEMALAENRSLADFNLSREPRLREGRSQLARLHQESQSVRDVYDKDRRRLDELQGSVSSDAAKVMLETAAEKAEEDSEEIADSFIQGNLTLDIFLEQFQAQRRIAHVRRIKADKLEELQRNGHISSPTSSSTPTSGVGGALPYPAPYGGAPLPHQQAQTAAGGSPYSSPARPAPGPPMAYNHGGTAMGYSAAPSTTAAPTQNQPWRPYGQQPGGHMQMPTLGSYPQ